MESILTLLNERYPMRFERVELLRDSGSLAYAAYTEQGKYFLRVVKPSLADTAAIGAGIQVFLQKRGFPVPPVQFTKEGTPYVDWEGRLVILYTFIEGEDSDPERDAESIGVLIGRLHQEMKEYTGPLVTRDRQFYIGRYIDILRKKNYHKANEYAAYGEWLWDRLKALPVGYCHGDVYCGNIRKAVDGKLYLHDFDTSCIGFPMYDAALICDATEYFRYDRANLSRSDCLLARFLPHYERYSHFSPAETKAFYDLIALQHFSTQATIVELFGPDCLDDAGIDAQLEWLFQWRDQCEN